MSGNEQSGDGEKLWVEAVARMRLNFKTDRERSQAERYVPMFVSHEIEGNEYIIGVSEKIQVDWFTPMFVAPLEQALHESGLPETIHVRFAVRGAATMPRPTSTARLIRPTVETPVAVQTAQNAMLSSTMPLNENYTFENFVKGPSNSFAHASATAVAKAPGKTYNNPLFIHGGTGLGKTHLMEAIGHFVRKNHPSAFVCFITAETFLNEYVNAIANNSMQAFRDRYRRVDVLLLDDVQFIAGKKQFQEEFFNTFNSLMGSGKQVVMTSDVAPKDLQGCEERLIGRFQQGMSVEIESPSYETRLAILKYKVQSAHRLIPEEILTYIAENIKSHVRALEGALARVAMFMDMNPTIPLTVEIAQNLLKNSIEEEKSIKDLTINEIMQTVAAYYGVTMADITSPQRTQTLVIPRQLAMFLSRKLTTKSLTEIAREFGKTHATIHYAIGTIQQHIDVEPNLKKALGEIASKLGRKPSDVLD